jgi:hypothetical protein
MAKQTFSSARAPTVLRTIPVLEFLLQSWENMAELPKFSEVEHAIRKGLENINKWYRKVNNTDAYFICLGTLVFLRDSILILKLVPVVASFRPNVQDCICQREMAAGVLRRWPPASRRSRKLTSQILDSTVVLTIHYAVTNYSSMLIMLPPPLHQLQTQPRRVLPVS